MHIHSDHRGRSHGRALRQGATLTQLLVVVLIIGVMTAIGLPTYTQTRKNANKKACEDSMSAIFQAEEAYRVRNRTYTATLSNLTTFMGATPTCPDGSSAYTVTVTGTGASQTILIKCPNIGSHGMLSTKYYGTADGATFAGY